jgi:hypothetical protein
VLGRTAGDSLSGYSVSVSSNGQRVQVQVSGTAMSMIPGISGLQVTQSASGPVERWTVVARGFANSEAFEAGNPGGGGP